MKFSLKTKNIFLCLFFFFIFLTSCFSSIFFLKVNASKYTTYTYAQIKEQTYLYKSNQSTQIQNALFMLPSSYFVKLLSNFSENFYKVEYNGIVGYVLKSQVMPVNEQPQTPYLKNITFRVYSSDGTKVFSSPTNTTDPQNTVVEQIEVLTPLTYYGEILGDEFISSRGFSWIYCKTTKGNFGYVYKGLCDNFSPITQNQEKVTYTTNVYFETDNSYLYNLVDVTPGLKVLLIILISVPSIILIYLLFKPFKIEQLKFEKTQTQKNTETEKNTKPIYKNKKSTQNKNIKEHNKISWIKNLKNKLFNKNTTQTKITNKTEYNKKTKQNINTNYKNNNENTSSLKNENYNNTNYNNYGYKNYGYKNSNYKNTKTQNKTLETIQKIIDDEPL